jgi:Rhodopirellula transposase DDE domain
MLMCCIRSMADPMMIETLKEKFEALQPLMSERLRRHWAATEAQALGQGGIAAVIHAPGLSRHTITRGMAERADTPKLSLPSPTRSRRPGGGRRPGIETDPTVIQALATLVEPTTRGAPMSPLRWTGKSPRTLAAALQRHGHRVGARTVARLLQALGYSLHANRKTREGSSHPERKAQCESINAQVRAFQERGQPVGSSDAKKKAWVGDFFTKGQEWPPQGTPEEVGTHDFPDPHLGKAIPSGVYEMTTNHGWISVGMDHDTAQLATATLRRWWQAIGSPVSPQAEALLVTADSGGSHSRRSRLWQVALQAVADEIGLPMSVCHLPPGTSKWHKIEHRMFCHITANWRGRPLRSLEVMVNLIGNTTTTTGLRMQAALETPPSPTGLKVSDEELAAVHMTKATFHGEWNYTISPRK